MEAALLLFLPRVGHAPQTERRVPALRSDQVQMTPKEQEFSLWIAGIVGGALVGLFVHYGKYEYAAGLAIYFLLTGMSTMVKRP
jgi:hypothetical protein